MANDLIKAVSRIEVNCSNYQRGTPQCWIIKGVSQSQLEQTQSTKITITRSEPNITKQRNTKRNTDKDA